MKELLFVSLSMIFITIRAARQYTKQTNLTHAYSLRTRYLIIISVLSIVT